MRALYRVRQFVSALTARLSEQNLSLAADVLTPGQLLLFRSLPPQDQAHALRVFADLQRQGEHDPLLLAAALLHDVGKVRCPLTVWEQVLVVLVGRLTPGLLARWGRSQPRGWRRAFVVAVQHPSWGADVLAQVGAPRRLIELVRHHQDEPGGVPDRGLSEQLRILRSVDNRN